MFFPCLEPVVHFLHCPVSPFLWLAPVADFPRFPKLCLAIWAGKMPGAFLPARDCPLCFCKKVFLWSQLTKVFVCNFCKSMFWNKRFSAVSFYRWSRKTKQLNLQRNLRCWRVSWTQSNSLVFSWPNNKSFIDQACSVKNPFVVLHIVSTRPLLTFAFCRLKQLGLLPQLLFARSKTTRCENLTIHPVSTHINIAFYIVPAISYQQEWKYGIALHPSLSL